MQTCWLAHTDQGAQGRPGSCLSSLLLPPRVSCTTFHLIMAFEKAKGARGREFLKVRSKHQKLTIIDVWPWTSHGLNSSPLWLHSWVQAGNLLNFVWESNNHLKVISMVSPRQMWKLVDVSDVKEQGLYLVKSKLRVTWYAVQVTFFSIQGGHCKIIDHNFCLVYCRLLSTNYRLAIDQLVSAALAIIYRVSSFLSCHSCFLWRVTWRCG